ncbi:FMRFamide-related peptides-like [Polistes fuscatus]|uniref:FMRFamide-related peptides-like n=1 Tax=Polistes fuscatus TaxID=30207 RepID=UPI001CA8BA6B|nr:FMRFamide-related peptides-like [Polistes fuscatus]
MRSLLSTYILICICFQCMVSSSIVTSLDGDKLNEFEYVLKRQRVENSDGQDSKERRSNMGSSFIRFGRSQSENGMDSETEEVKVDRHPRWKSPDITIRFGRSDIKNIHPGRIYEEANNLNIVRNELYSICSDMLVAAMSGNKDERSYIPRILRFCNTIEERIN